MIYRGHTKVVVFHLGTNRAALIANLFLYCNERDFMSNPRKSKRFDLIDRFNDTSQDLDDIFTIDNSEFAEHIPDIYPRELQLNKTNTSDKETSFLDLNMKVIGSNIYTWVYDKRDDFGFPKVNFPCLSGDIPLLPTYGIYISQLVRYARCCTTVFDFHSKNLQSLKNYWHRVTDITSFWKFLESSSGHTLKLVQYRFKNMYLKE